VRQKIEQYHETRAGLHLGEEHCRSLIEVTTAVVWNMLASGKFEVEQPPWSDFTGQTFEQLNRWGWLDAVHPDDRPNTVRVWSEAVAGQSPGNLNASAAAGSDRRGPGRLNMAIHAWTRVEPGASARFHQCWLVAIGNAQNGGLLPPGYYAMAE
jgi:hypothetical protein